MFEYLTLANTIDNAMATQTNTNLKLLMQIAYDGLTGALHSKTLNRDNVELNLQVALLNKKVDDILSGKNEVSTMACTSGEIVITKTFKLAPLYSYYIHLYGMPAYGVGFDTAKLTLVASILQKYGINPFPG
jgi:O-acetyl-ADP-ribose deacetylase (regulator of RNase III)